MPSTHTSLHVHVTFSTKERVRTIDSEWRLRLHEYLAGCIKSLDAQPVAVGGVADHVHLLFGIKPTHSIADLLREIKKGSTAWAMQFDKRFRWQDGYGAFTVSRRDVEGLVAYIRDQETHHQKVSFQDEYLQWLRDEGVHYDPKYLW